MNLKLDFNDILTNGTKIRLTRAQLTTVRPKQLHEHNFYELFWVQNGAIRHHLPTGTEMLREGDVVFVAPGQAHGLQGRGEQAFIVSLCIHPDTIMSLGKRHPQFEGKLFWAKDGSVVIHCDLGQMTALNQAALKIERSARDTLAAEALLLPLCASLTQVQLPAETPDWLAAACLAAEDPAVFREGSAGLVAVAGKAHPHVSRSMRKFLGLTPSDYINQIRMEYAARALTTDSDPISQIAADCGLPNMSHFHKLFRATHGVTPLQYRQRFQRQILQPV